MAIPSSGQSLAFSALRTEFVGGSSAVSLSDLYRGGSNIIKKAANNPATNLAASVATGSITESNLSAQFGDDYAVDYPKVVTIPANTTLGADDPAEYGLEVDAGAAGTITITNSGTIVGSGGAGGGAGSANAGAGPNGFWQVKWSGNLLAQGAPWNNVTSWAEGSQTFYKGSPTEQNNQNSPENDFQYNFGRSYIYRTFPQTVQNQVAGHNGGAGGSGGLGRGFQNLPAGDSGAGGASGSTGQAGNGGAGGAGGAGGGYGQAGASGSTGQAGVASTTGGASGGAGGSGGAAGLAVERASPISFNFTNNGTVAGTVQS